MSKKKKRNTNKPKINKNNKLNIITFEGLLGALNAVLWGDDVIELINKVNDFLEKLSNLGLFG